MIKLLVQIAIVALLTACGPNTRQQTLRAVYVGATAAQAGFVAWDHEHTDQIAKTAPSFADGVRELEAYKVARSPVIAAFEATYRTLAAAALLEEDQKTLISAVGAFEQLRLALRTLTKGRLP